MFNCEITIMNPVTREDSHRTNVTFMSAWACNLMVEKYVACKDVSDVDVTDMETGELVYSSFLGYNRLNCGVTVDQELVEHPVRNGGITVDRDATSGVTATEE